MAASTRSLVLKPDGTMVPETFFADNAEALAAALPDGIGSSGSVWRNGEGVPDNGTGANGDYYLRTSNGDVYQRSAGTYSVVANIKGATGGTGDVGAPGSPGAAGSVWRSGSGAPDNGTGANGDYYLRTSNGDVYLRSAGTYSTVGSIKGATGDTGAAGSVWRHGSGVPDNGTGANGDYYLRTSNGDVYQRSAGTYSVVANIKGADGDSGSGGGVETPRVYHVASHGNDSTVDGSPSAPYLTAQAAYNAGVTGAASFVIQLGIGSYSIDLTTHWSYLCYGVFGVGVLSQLTVVGTPAEVSGPGVKGYTIDSRFLNCAAVLTSNGSNVNVNGDQEWTGGVGGDIVVRQGSNARLQLTSKGGGVGTSPGDGWVVGAPGGLIIVKHGTCEVLSIDTTGGIGYNYGGSYTDGSPGSYELSGCDIMAAMSFVGTATVGNCVCPAGFTPTNDKGGNAFW